MGASSFGRSGRSDRGGLLRSLAAAAATLCVLAPLLSPSSSPLPLLVAEAAVVPGPFGDHAVVSAPAGYFASWEGNQLFPDTGFCLSESEGRVLQNWSSPLYQRRIVVAAEGGPGMSMVSAHQHSERGHAGREASEREDGATRRRRPVPSSVPLSLTTCTLSSRPVVPSRCPLPLVAVILFLSAVGLDRQDLAAGGGWPPSVVVRRRRVDGHFLQPVGPRRARPPQ